MSIDNTPESRLRALQDARELLTGGGSTNFFGENKAPAPKPFALLRLAHYITTGRDYAERDEVPAELLMPPIMLHDGNVASMIERKYPDEVSALSDKIGHANVDLLTGSPEFESIVTQEAGSYHDDACIGKREDAKQDGTDADPSPEADGGLRLVAGSTPPDEADFGYTPDEGDEYKQYDGPRDADNLVSVWKFRDGSWVDVTAYIEEEKPEQETPAHDHLHGVSIQMNTPAAHLTPVALRNIATSHRRNIQ